MAADMRRPVFGLNLCIVVAVSLLVIISEAATGTAYALVMPNTDLALCTCDLSVKACDVNCCCDTDCDNSDRAAFSRCIDAPKISDSRMCVQQSLIFIENSPFQSTVERDLLCIKVDNYQERNFYNVPQTIVNVAHFDMFRATYGGYSYQHQEPTSVKHDDFYRSGDPILTVYKGGAQGQLGLPAPLVTSECADSNPAAFMYNQELECHRVIADLKTECTNNPLINANLYYGGFKLVKSPAVLKNYVVYASSYPNASDGTTTGLGTTAPVITTDGSPPAAPQAIALYDSSDVIEIELWSVTCIDENGLEFNCNINVTNATAVPSPHFEIAGKGPDRCMSVVTDVEYFIKHSGNAGLVKAYVRLTLTDIPVDKVPIAQKFKISFYKAGEKDIFKRSGRPGYVVGEPVMAGKLVTNTTTSLQAIELHKDRSKWLTLVSSTISGDCMTTPDHRVPVTFGEEMRAGCKVRVTLNNMTNNCVFIQDIVLEALRGTDPSTHVATFGDSDVRFVGDWLAIQGLYTQPPQAQAAQGGECRNLVVGMLTQIVYADVGSLQHPQSKILGVLVTYQTAMVKFQCAGKYCQPGNTDTQDLEVASTVNFIDASSAPVSTSGERPTVPVRLPSDFFYPFT
ncbi:Tectonic-3 [Lamellibrachia satsuma]|nr:Tectonic-3 [Lamellibrachia satsuma]